MDCDRPGTRHALHAAQKRYPRHELTAQDRIARMITGELKSKIDRVWDAFWSGGISNPLEVIEQITYLLFLRRLDELELVEESRATILGEPKPFHRFGAHQQHLRWSAFKNTAPAEMFTTIRDEAFPFLQQLGQTTGTADESTYSQHMKDARFTIPTPALLDRVVGLLSEIPMERRDTNGDLYEYLLSKLASAGVNGQFRTPRHIIELMVAMADPNPNDVICETFRSQWIQIGGSHALAA